MTTRSRLVCVGSLLLRRRRPRRRLRRRRLLRLRPRRLRLRRLRPRRRLRLRSSSRPRRARSSHVRGSDPWTWLGRTPGAIARSSEADRRAPEPRTPRGACRHVGRGVRLQRRLPRSPRHRTGQTVRCVGEPHLPVQIREVHNRTSTASWCSTSEQYQRRFTDQPFAGLPPLHSAKSLPAQRRVQICVGAEWVWC